MTKHLFKIHIGLIIGFILTFLATFIVTIISSNFSQEKSPIPISLAFFFTYEYLIINFIKGDYLTKEHEKGEKISCSEYTRFSSYLYRRIIKIFLSICIIMIPIMWGLSIITYIG